MFVLRAVFWIPVVAILIPSEPDFGSPPGEFAGRDIFYSAQAKALDVLSRVKADIAAQRREESAPLTATPEFSAEPALRSD